MTEEKEANYSLDNTTSKFQRRSKVFKPEAMEEDFNEEEEENKV